MKLPDPLLQIGFATLLNGSRKTVLRDALRDTVRQLSIKALDAELAQYVPDRALGKLAAFRLRGEAVFPTPLVLKAQPTLIGYYRLLFGYSQKQFYGAATGCGPLGAMEKRGTLSTAAEAMLPELCRAFADSGTLLLDAIEDHLHNPELLHELSLLTLGAQYRGGANNERGAAGIKTVFGVIRSIVEASIVSEGETVIEVENAAGKRVQIALAADPDILIKSFLTETKTRPVVAIEVKAGEDQSNIHNRIGEAEKSHQKARAQGVTECWTIINVAQADLATLRLESRSTDRFFQLLDLVKADSDAFADFADHVRERVGLA